MKEDRKFGIVVGDGWMGEGAWEEIKRIGWTPIL